MGGRYAAYTLFDATGLLYLLVVVGDGASLPAIGKQVRRLGLDARVHLAGRVPADDVPRWLALADVGVVTYRDDCRNNEYCAPNKLYEYCAADVPVVASDVAGVRAAMGELLAAERPDDEVAALRRVLMGLAFDADIALDLHCDSEAVLHLFLGTSLLPGAADLSAQIGSRATLLATVSGGNPFDVRVSLHVTPISIDAQTLPAGFQTTQPRVSV